MGLTFHRLSDPTESSVQEIKGAPLKLNELKRWNWKFFGPVFWLYQQEGWHVGWYLEMY